MPLNSVLCQPLRTQYAIYRERFSNVLDIGSPNGLIEDLLIGECFGARVAYASVYGAAMASEVTHVFGALGTRFVLQTGCCGAWTTTSQSGDLYIPTTAFCGEGAAQYYTETSTVNATVSLDYLRESVEGVTCHRGGIYTTAALFAEGRTEIEQWATDGWQAVDMETATTFAVAEHFGMDSAGLLYVFDNPRRQADITMNDEDLSMRRKRGNSTMIEASFRIVKQYLETRKQTHDDGRSPCPG